MKLKKRVIVMKGTRPLSDTEIVRIWVQLGLWGSGLAQCALGILLDDTDNDDPALRWYQSLKSEVIAHMLQDKKIQLAQQQVREWLAKKQVTGRHV